MHTVLGLTAALLLVLPLPAAAQDARATLAAVATAMGADGLPSVEYSGSGVTFSFGQSAAPGQPWPRLNIKSFTRSLNYETASLHDEIVRTQGENPIRGGGQQPIRGEQRQSFFVRGEHAWNMTAVPAPIALAERQFQLWATPHGVVKAAAAHNATVQGRVIVFTVPGRMRVRAALSDQNLVERVEALLPHPVLGDTAVEVTYAEYKDFGSGKFPTRIRRSAGGRKPVVEGVRDRGCSPTARARWSCTTSPATPTPMGC
jgi:hypothetical protein